MGSNRNVHVFPFALAVFLAELAGCARAPASAAPPPRRPVTFSGVITDVSTGAPVPLVGATVVVNRVGKPEPVVTNIDEDGNLKSYEDYSEEVERLTPPDYRQAVTNERGEFQFEVAPDRYEVDIYYVSITVRRVIDVRKPTVMTQSIDSSWYGGFSLTCTSESASSCGTPEDHEHMRESRTFSEEQDRLRAEEQRVHEAEALRATEAAAEAERQRVADQEKAENAKRASNRTKQGLAFLAESVFDAALEEFLAAYELAPVPQGLYHLGLAYEGLKDRTSALDAYKRYVEAEPDGVEADEARKRIAKLTKELKKK